MINSNSRKLDPRFRHSSLFTSLDSDQLHTILPYLKKDHWNKGQQAMADATNGKYFYVLLQGRIKVGAQNPITGRWLTLFTLNPGDGHSLANLLDGKPHHLLTETLTDSVAVGAPTAQWQSWLEQYPALRQAAMRMAAKQLRDLALLAEDLALYETSARLAHMLLREFHANDAIDGTVFKDMVHEDIAELIGSVRVVVNRLLNHFKREGIIETEAGKIRIADLDRLRLKTERDLLGLNAIHRSVKPKPSD